MTWFHVKNSFGVLCRTYIHALYITGAKTMSGFGAIFGLVWKRDVVCCLNDHHVVHGVAGERRQLLVVIVTTVWQGIHLWGGRDNGRLISIMEDWAFDSDQRSTGWPFSNSYPLCDCSNSKHNLWARLHERLPVCSHFIGGWGYFWGVCTVCFGMFSRGSLGKQGTGFVLTHDD